MISVPRGHLHITVINAPANVSGRETNRSQQKNERMQAVVGVVTAGTVRG